MTENEEQKDYGFVKASLDQSDLVPTTEALPLYVLFNITKQGSKFMNKQDEITLVFTNPANSRIANSYLILSRGQINAIVEKLGKSHLQLEEEKAIARGEGHIIK